MRYAISVTTTKPSSTLTPGGGGGCLSLLDPNTGAILSSLRSITDLSGKTGMGISSLSPFPQCFSTSSGNGESTQPVIAYGGNSVKKGDNYGMLISIRSASSPPIQHWKCRLPETEMSGGLLVSPCGYYVVGGGASGSCYIWSSMGGQLLRTIKAHYRSCTSLAWSDCGRYLVTGGADGMVHVFSLMDLVDVTYRIRNNSKRDVPPIHTFSIHHFPVTSLTRLSSGRIVSAAEDGQVVVMELFSQQVLVNIQFPHGIQCLEHYDGRIYAGSIQGTIYSVDLNAYAMHQTEKQGAIFANNKRRRHEQVDLGSNSNWTDEEIVFGKKIADNTTGSTSSNSGGGSVYQTDWIGHENPVTSIALLTENEPRKMISGDNFGQIRIWDIESRTCMNIIQPWSHGMSTVHTTSSDDGAGKSSSGHPVTSIHIIPQHGESSGMFQSPASNKNVSNLLSLLTALQKYVADAETSDGTTASSIAAGIIRVPFLKTNRTAANSKYWESRPILRRKRQLLSGPNNRLKSATDEDHSGQQQQQQQQPQQIEQVALLSEQIKHLQDQLKEKQLEVKRWESVNNKLMSRLQTKP